MISGPGGTTEFSAGWPRLYPPAQPAPGPPHSCASFAQEPALSGVEEMVQSVCLPPFAKSTRRIGHPLCNLLWAEGRAIRKK